MTDLETAEQRVRRLYARHGSDSDAITTALWAELGDLAEAEDVLRLWVRERVAHQLRDIELRSLISTDGPGSRAAHVPAPQSERVPRKIVHRAGPNPSIDSVLDFLNCSVGVPGAPGGRKLYGEMTIEDHAARIGQTRAWVATGEKIIANGEWAQKAIADHGVTCLNDIPRAELAAELPDGGVTRP